MPMHPVKIAGRIPPRHGAFALHVQLCTEVVLRFIACDLLPAAQRAAQLALRCQWRLAEPSVSMASPPTRKSIRKT